MKQVNSDTLNFEDIINNFMDSHAFDDRQNYFKYVDGRGTDHRIYVFDDHIEYKAYNRDNKKIKDFSFNYSNDIELKKGLKEIEEFINTQPSSRNFLKPKETRLSSVLKKIKNSAKASYAIGTVGYSQEEPSSIAVFKDTNLSLNEALTRTLGSDPYGDWQQGGKGVVALYDYDDNGEYIIGFSKQIHEVFVYDNFEDYKNDVINGTFLDIPEAQEILEPITDPKKFIATSNKLAKKYDTYTEEYGLLKLVATINLETMDVNFVI